MGRKSQSFGRTGHIAVALGVWLALAGLLLVPLGARAQTQATPGTTATACAIPSPVATMVPGDGTGAATPPATPAPVGLATPVTADCLTVTLTIDKSEAGPRVLTVTVKDESGQPVTGAEVTLKTKSLAMDHGISSYTAKSTKPGVYVASDVSLGMGGKWQTEVMIGRPGTGRADVVFVFSLNGPKM